MYTLAFSGSEYWCPYCGHTEGIFGAGIDVENTTKLRDRFDKYVKLTKPYLRAMGRRACSATKYRGEWVRPQDLPQRMKTRDQNIINSWEYGQKP